MLGQIYNNQQMRKQELALERARSFFLETKQLFAVSFAI